MAISVYFATNRNPIDDSAIPNNFGTDFNPAGDVLFGRAILQSVADESELGNSNLAIDALNPGEFPPAIRQAIVGGEDHLLITLHGFDYRFREAMMRAGYVGAWFGKGKPAVSSTIVAFSWPSLGSLTVDAYKKDYQSAGSSGGAFRRFLLALMPVLSAYRKGGANRRVTLMAHSMGNHFLHAGLQAAVGTAPGQIAPSALAEVVDQVVLIASDEDADALSSGVGVSSLVGVVKSMVVYYNNQDIPLTTISRAAHGIGRLGMDGAPDKLSFAGKNIAFVNCSAANPKLKNGERLDPQWHQYYRLVPEVRDDLCGVMLGRSQLPNRVYRAAENYYRLNLRRP
ncbi:MAG TPA: alpha/beta hydrolase [Dongiaceae bacterium]|jgi:esterase/lipase superfamily enzyme|nr:alpha/beta hydrolase [Dongiaceae bacterium]